MRSGYCSMLVNQQFGYGFQKIFLLYCAAQNFQNNLVLVSYHVGCESIFYKLKFFKNIHEF